MGSLKKNVIYQVAYQILLIILPFVTSPYLSRVIGAQGLGEYSYSYSIAFFFSLFIMLGVNNYGTREIAKIKDDKINVSKTFFSIYVIQLLMGILVLLLYIITQISFPNNFLGKIQIIYLISSMLDVNWLFFGLEKFKITVTRNFIVKLLTVISVFIWVKDRDDILIYTIIMSIGFLVTQISLWPFVFKEITKVKITLKDIIYNIKPLWILFIPVVAASIFKYMDKIMLGFMCSKSELGFYDNAEKIMLIPTGLITAVGTVMLPRITNMMNDSQNSDKVKEYIKVSLISFMHITSALTFGLIAIAPTFVEWFWGTEFIVCGKLISFLAPSVLFVSWANVIRTQYLIPNNMDKVYVKSFIYGAITNILINLLLIKQYGALGTVIGTVMAEFVVALYQTIKCYRHLPICQCLKETVQFILMGMIMCIGVICVRNVFTTLIINLLLEFFVGVMIYVILTVLYYKMKKKFISKGSKLQ